MKTARLLAQALDVSLACLYCDDDDVAELLLQLNQLDAARAQRVVEQALKVAEQVR